MRAVDLIEKKRFGGVLTAEEISWLIQSYVCGDIPDYQMSAFLMAVCYSGMSLEETVTMRNQYEVFGDAPVSYGNYHAFEPDVESDGWESALELSKMLVSVVCNPNLSDEEKIALFESWVPNPFEERLTDVGDHNASPGKMTQHRSLEYWNNNFDGQYIDGYEVFGYVIIDGNVFFETVSW